MTGDSDAKEWVTVKVPKADREQANDYRPDGVTYGECLVAGAERLNDHLASSPPPGVPEGEGIDPEAIADAVREELDTDAPTFDDVRGAIETIEERTGRIERTLEDLQR